MPLMICPKCSRFHYVPGDCPPSIAAVRQAREAMDAAPVSTEGRQILSHDISDPVQRAALVQVLDNLDVPKKKGRGRPATGFDKKKHDREKAKARRAAKAKPA